MYKVIKRDGAAWFVPAGALEWVVRRLWSMRMSYKIVKKEVLCDSCVYWIDGVGCLPGDCDYKEGKAKDFRC